MNLQFYKHHSH